MKYTLLELTQKVLSSIDGDQVDSIGDTVEAQQVVDIIQRVYDEITPKSELPEDLRLFKFDATSPDTPVLMTRPSFIDDVRWIKYDCIDTGETEPHYKEIRYLTPEDFLSETLSYANQTDHTGSFAVLQDTGQTITVYYKTDAPPKYWTSFDDQTVTMNSLQTSIESNLQQSKSLGYGRFIKTFTKSDDFVPPLDENLFPLLLAECISVAWADLKQAQNAKAEKSARKGWISSQRRKDDLPGHRDPLSDLRNYGR